MRISKIRLNNFRGYRGENEVIFSSHEDKNITLIAGKNGFGKTTFLTALIWGFYGKLMAQVEDKYKREIKNSGGYDNYLFALFNKHERWSFEKGEALNSNFFVEVELEDLLIPSIPCRKVLIRREFNPQQKEEKLSILIDGDENELTQEVGFEVFINDFILPREIAKFFFFDAEKIVSLAEAKNRAELRSLSRAYSEVLGIKKYEELKKNLEALLSKLRRNGVTKTERSKLDKLILENNQIKKEIEHNLEQQNNVDQQLLLLSANSDRLQEKLIREGNGITLEELKKLKDRREVLKINSANNKAELKRFLDIVPLVIAGKKLVQLYDQLSFEISVQTSNANFENIESELNAFSKKLMNRLNQFKFEEEIEEKIKTSITQLLDEKQGLEVLDKEDSEILLDYSEEKFRDFQAILENIRNSFHSQFQSLSQKEKNNRIILSQINNKIKQAEARKGNPHAKELRREKIETDDRIKKLKDEKLKLVEILGGLNVKLSSHSKVLSEYEKQFKLVETDKKKYQVTENLLAKINSLITKIKDEKKYSLQKSISLNLRKLMHKKEFIKDVNVRIEGDVMDVDLLDSEGKIIDKDTMLSKGEQQLYATALLKALVDESGIEFPVFIDSPLQKFDNVHSVNIIKEFYPHVSEQVVLFPLLEKELTFDEFQFLKPNISKTYLIKNKRKGSKVSEVSLNNLFEEFKKQDHVLSH